MQFDEMQRRSRELFRQEASDLLPELEAALLQLERVPSDTGTIDRVFRAMHTLKGSGATCGFADLSNFLHHVEDVYNAAREGRLQVSLEIINLSLKIVDAVHRYLAAEGEEAAAVLSEQAPNLQALLAFLPAHGAGKPAETAPPKAPEENTFHIEFRPHPELFLSGSDPAMFLDDLRTLGTCQVRALTDLVPKFEALDPERCYLAWEIILKTKANEAAVRDVFQFVEDLCDLTIAPHKETTATQPAAAQPVRAWRLTFSTSAGHLAAPGVLETLWQDLQALGALRIVTSPADGRVGDWTVEVETAAGEDALGDAFAFLPGCKLAIAQRPEAAPAPQPANTHGPKHGDNHPAALPAKADDSATEHAKRQGAKTPHGDAKGHANTVRVSAQRLDQLVNLVGELVILRSQVATACATNAGVPLALHGAAEVLGNLTTEMRDVVLNIRMTPIGQTFDKFRRLTRDLARELGKEVDLHIEGAETELDKTILDQLGDPLVHLVRNALDHGLEAPEERKAAGKPAKGTLRLSAQQRGDRVIVTVSDDGRGLNPAKIRQKAINRGLCAEDAQLSDNDLFQLVFLPGFSTADVVSQVSGRGVGLDVVKRHVEALRGRIDLRSQPGKGAEFRLALPLTLAIIEGLMVSVGSDRYILHMGSVRETVELPKPAKEKRSANMFIPLRGELVPYLRLRDLFGMPEDGKAVERVVITELEDRRIGIAVDEVLGNHQTVIRSLGWIANKVPLFSGATILGDGRIALILDIPEVANRLARG